MFRTAANLAYCGVCRAQFKHPYPVVVSTGHSLVFSSYPPILLVN